MGQTKQPDNKPKVMTELGGFSVGDKVTFHSPPRGAAKSRDHVIKALDLQGEVAVAKISGKSGWLRLIAIRIQEEEVVFDGQARIDELEKEVGELASKADGLEKENQGLLQRSTEDQAEIAGHLETVEKLESQINTQVDEINQNANSIASLDAQSAAKDKTIADLEAKVAELTPTPS